MESFTTQDLTSARLLIVDDVQLNREIMREYLKKEGFHNIEDAADGDEALEKINTFAPHLMILDLIMPRLDGFEVIKRVRGARQHADLPIIVQTAIDAPEQRSDAWSSGANDVVTKPVHRLELLARVRFQLANSRNIKVLEKMQREMEEDLLKGVQLQKSLLPKQAHFQTLEQKYNIKINMVFLPSQHLSGDLCGITDMGNHKLGIWLFDICGHGVQAALDSFRLHTLMREYEHAADDPAELIDALNNRLNFVMSVGRFATCLVGILDLEKEIFSYASAGAPHPLAIDYSTYTYQVGDGSGMPLGIQKNQLYPIRTLPFKPKQSIVLHSDALWESPEVQDLFLLEPNIDHLLQGANANNAFLSDQIQDYLEAHKEVSPQDDLTLIEVVRR